MAPRKKNPEVNEKYDPAQPVTFADLIATFNVSSRHLTTMIDGGYITKTKDGSYKLCEAVQGGMRYKSDHGVKRSGSTKEAAGIKVQEARARQIEQEIAITARDLITFTECCAVIDLLLGGLNSELDGLPTRFTRDRTLREQYAKEVRDMKERLRQRWERMLSQLESDAGVTIDGEEEETP